MTAIAMIIALSGVIASGQNSATDQTFLAERTGMMQTTVAVNPVTDFDCPDPSLVKIGEWYYMFATGYPIRIYRSRGLCNWAFYRNMFPGPNGLDPYGTGEIDPMHTGAETINYWAPSPALINGKVVVYLTLFASMDNDRQVVCTADDIDGSFKYAGTLNVGTPEHPTPQDGQYFLDDDGRAYLVWGDVNSKGNFVRELSDDGLTYAEGSQPYYITQKYEGGYIYKYKGRYYYFCSKGYYNNSKYTLYLSTADDIKGPWSTPEPVLMSESSDAVLNGPGHNGEIVTDNQGRMFMIMHCHCEGLIPADPNVSSYRPRPALLMELKEIDGTLKFVDHKGTPTLYPQWLVNVPDLTPEP